MIRWRAGLAVLAVINAAKFSRDVAGMDMLTYGASP